MAYIGKTPQVGAYQKCDALTASATADYTLQVGSSNVSPESVNHMIVSLNGVIQQPGASGGFTVSGSTLSFTSALTSSDTIDFVILLGNVLDIGTPSDATVATAKIQDDAVTLAKMAAGTDGNIISYDTSGNPVAVATGTDGQVLTSSGAGAVCAFEDAAGLTAGTKVSPTAANVTFTGIPSTAKNILISFKGLSHSHGSNSDFGVTIGDSGGLETTGYEATVIYTGTGDDQGGNNYTDKFTFWYSTGAASTLNGIAQLTNLDGNTWCFSSQAADGNNYIGHGAGFKALSGTLTQVSIFSAAGGTLDAGDINILYQ